MRDGTSRVRKKATQAFGISTERKEDTERAALKS